MAQESPTDSLVNLLQRNSIHDTTRLNTLIALSNVYADDDIEKGLATADEAIVLANKINNNALLGKAYFAKAINFMNNDDYEEVINTLSLAINAYTKANDSMGIARSYFGKGLAYFNLSAYDTAIQFHQKALKIYTAIGDQKRIANTLNSIGANYRNLSDYAVAIDYYLKALATYEKLKSKIEIAMVLSNVGMIYKDIEDYSNAQQYYQKALTIYRNEEDKAGIAKTLKNIAIAYDEVGNSDKALNIFSEALKMNQELGLKFEISSNLNALGIIYFDRGQYSKALPFFKESIAISSKLNDKRAVGITSNYIGRLYLNCPDSILQKEGIPLSNRYKKALEFQERGFELAQQTGSLSQQSSSLQSLSETYEALHDYKKALDYHKQFLILKDSAFNEKKSNEIVRKQMQYDFEKKAALVKAEHDKQQALADAEIKRQYIIRNTIIGGAVILLLGSLSTFVFYKRKKDAEVQKTAAEFKAEVADVEMKALRAQMNPHFIFNSLNSIGDYISKNNIQTADIYLTKFAKLIRMILEHSEQKEIPLADELKALELYIQLEALRMNNKFTYLIKTADDIDVENTLVPPLILQPFVENSIWHGFVNKQDAGVLSLQFNVENDMLKCVVEDNGVGRKASAREIKKDKSSLGLKITQSRIDILNKLKKSNAGIAFHDLSTGTKVEVSLPLELSF